EEWAALVSSEGVGEAVAEVQVCGVIALSPALICLGCSLGRLRRQRNDHQPEIRDDPSGVIVEASPGGNDEEFGQGSCGDDALVPGCENGRAKLPSGLFQRDCHERRGVARYQCGGPSSS